MQKSYANCIPLLPKKALPGKQKRALMENTTLPKHKKESSTKKRNVENNKKPKSDQKASSGVQEDRHEKNIKKLKLYVSKCGVRKNWKSELNGLSPVQSIERLKEILETLGMKGRPSLAQCKSIKEQLELQRELDDLISSEKEDEERGSSTSMNEKSGLDDAHGDKVSPQKVYSPS